MTNAELNRDWKRLAKKAKQYYDSGLFGTEKELELQKEFKRLYRADDTFKYCNKQSIRIAMRINLKIRAVSLHLFGIGIDL